LILGEGFMAEDCEHRSKATHAAVPMKNAIRALAAIIALLLGAGAGPAQAQIPAGCPAPAVPASPHPEEPPNLGLLKLQLRAYRCSSYDADVANKLAEARAWVEERAGKVVNPALVLDIDETSLSNWEQIFRNDFGFIPSGACDHDSETAC